MKLSGLKVFTSLCLAVLLSAPAWASPSTANTALPGTVNYVEGQVDVGSQTLGPKSIGQVTLQTGESLATSQGKAEILLTPGVFLRLGDNSSAKMISPSLTNTQVQVQGQAMVEVDDILPENNLRIVEDGIPTQLLKNGLYGFVSNHNLLQVFKGQAAVLEGDQQIKINGGHQFALNETGKPTAQKLDKKEYEQSDLYRWSSLRSSYLAQASMETSRIYIDYGWWGPGSFGPWGFWGGWGWSPWFGAYTFFPGNGILYSPFGWGFYSPLVVYRSPVLRGPGFYAHAGAVRNAPRGTAHSGFAEGEGFHGGMEGGAHSGGAMGHNR
jgi:hypothetical protein